MPATFSDSGVSFRYPETWKLEREEIDAGWLVTVQSPGTASSCSAIATTARRLRNLPTRRWSDFCSPIPELEAEPASTATPAAWPTAMT